MKIERIDFSFCDGVTQVSVVALVQPGEGLDWDALKRAYGELLILGEQAASRDPEITKDDRQQEVVGVLQQTNEIFHEMVQPEGRRRRHRNPLETESAPVEEQAQESPTRRRRRSADGATQAITSAASSPNAQGQSDVNPPRRRRTVGGVNSPTPEAASTSPASTDTLSQLSTRRRRAVPAEAASASPATAPTPADMSPSRRRTAASVENQSPARTTSSARSSETQYGRTKSLSDEKITDADLSKACSEAARVLTPKVVMEYVKTFGATQAGAIKPADRRRFLDGLKAKKEAA